MPRSTNLALLLVAASMSVTGACTSSSKPERPSVSTTDTATSNDLARFVCGGLRGLDTAIDATTGLFEQLEEDSLERAGLRRSLVAQVRGAAEAANEGAKYVSSQAQGRSPLDRKYLAEVASQMTKQGQQLQDWSTLVATFPIEDRDNWEDSWQSWRDSKFLPFVDASRTDTGAAMTAAPLGASVVKAARTLDDCATIDIDGYALAPQK